MSKVWKVYLSGEIHTDWRDQIIHSAQELALPVEFSTPQLVHEISDQCGTTILGEEEKRFWADHKAAKINSIHNQKAILESDLVVIRFGDQYKQWNAAFDAGWAIAHNKPVVTLHAEELTHALKEINAAAVASAREPVQVVQLLRYLVTGSLDVF